MTSSVVDPTVAAGNWNPAEHPRDSEGKFAEKPGGPGISFPKKTGPSSPQFKKKSAGGGASGVGGGPGKSGGKSLKITHALIHKKHAPGTVIAESGDGNTRVRWNGNEYDIEVKTGKGEWVSGKSVKKSKLYKELGNFEEDWFEPGDQEKSDAPSVPEPSSEKGESELPDTGDFDVVDEPGDVPEPAGKLNITKSDFEKDFQVGDVIAEAPAHETGPPARIVWDGYVYRVQFKPKETGGWLTDATYTDVDAMLADIDDPLFGEWKMTNAGEPDVEPTVPTPSILSHQPMSMANYKKISGQMGSQLGGLFRDEHGEKQYVKVSKSTNHALNEVLANQLYQAAGVEVPEVGFVTIDDQKFPGHGGSLGTQSKVIVGEMNMMKKLSSIDAQYDPGYAKKLRENFAVDAWLANWDVVGTGFDNIITDINSNPIRIDAGGALLYRAQGGPKGSKFGDTVTEIDTMRSAVTAPYAAQVFKNVTDIDIRKGVAKIEKITPEQIDAMVDSIGFSYTTAVNLKKTLKARRQDLINKYGTKASLGEPKKTEAITDNYFTGSPNPLKDQIVLEAVGGKIRLVWNNDKYEYAYQQFKSDGKWHTTSTWQGYASEKKSMTNYLKAHGDIWVKPKDPSLTKTDLTPDPTPPQPKPDAAPDAPKVFTLKQRMQVQQIFTKNGVKWYNDTKKIYDSALEASKADPNITMGDALDIMDQSLKKKSGSPFRTKVEKFLKTNAGKNYAYSKGGSAKIGATQQTVPPASTSGYTPLTLPKKLTSSHATLMQKDMDTLHPPPWTASQKAAIKNYTGNGYTAINKCLRGTGQCPPAIKGKIAAIRAAMKPSTNDVKLFRKTNAPNFGLKHVSQLDDLEGKVITDKGVISTSISDQVWSGEIHIQIDAPKGTKMAWVKPISQHQNENEMLLAPGTKFRVLSVRKHHLYDFQRIVLVEVIPGSDEE